MGARAARLFSFSLREGGLGETSPAGFPLSPPSPGERKRQCFPNIAALVPDFCRRQKSCVWLKSPIPSPPFGSALVPCGGVAPAAPSPLRATVAFVATLCFAHSAWYDPSFELFHIRLGHTATKAGAFVLRLVHEAVRQIARGERRRTEYLFPLVQLSAQCKKPAPKRCAGFCIGGYFALRASEVRSDADGCAICAIRYVAPFSGSRGLRFAPNAEILPPAAILE